MERETFNVPQDEIDDFTGEGSWEINDDLYTWVETIRTAGDGEWFDVITKREGDGTYFRFSWGISWSQTYRYGEEWKEVFPKTITKTIYE